MLKKGQRMTIELPTRYLTLTSEGDQGDKRTYTEICSPYESFKKIHTSLEIQSNINCDVLVFSERGNLLQTYPPGNAGSMDQYKNVLVNFTNRVLTKDTKTEKVFTVTHTSFTITHRQCLERPIHLPELGIILATPSTRHQVMSFEKELQNIISVLNLDFNKEFRFHVNPSSFRKGEVIPDVHVFDGIRTNIYPLLEDEEIEIGVVKVFASRDSLNITGVHGLDFICDVRIECLRDRPKMMEIITNLGVNKYFISFDYQVVSVIARMERKTPQFTQDELLSTCMTVLEERAKTDPNLTLEEAKLHLATFQDRSLIKSLQTTLEQKQSEINALATEINELKSSLEIARSNNEKIRRENHFLQMDLEDNNYQLKRERYQRKEDQEDFRLEQRRTKQVITVDKVMSFLIHGAKLMKPWR